MGKTKNKLFSEYNNSGIDKKKFSDFLVDKIKSLQSELTKAREAHIESLEKYGHAPECNLVKLKYKPSLFTISEKIDCTCGLYAELKKLQGEHK